MNLIDVRYRHVASIDDITLLVYLVRQSPDRKEVSARIMDDLKRVSAIIGTRITKRRPQ
jgi:hypothetical protein